MLQSTDQPNMKSLSSPTTKIQKAIQNIENGMVLSSYGSLKVTGNSISLYSAYEFLLAFHSN